MKKISRLALVVIFTAIVFLPLSGHPPTIVERSFSGLAKIELNLVSGDCFIAVGSDEKIVVRLEYEFDRGGFKPKFVEQADGLVLGEEFAGNVSGHSVWKITLPAKTAIRFKSASGNLNAAGGVSGIIAASASGDIELSRFAGNCRVDTASGDITLKSVTGPLDVTTASGEITAESVIGEAIRITSASGDIAVKNSQGGFTLISASGNINADRLVIEKPSQFRAASGDVTIRLAATPKVDLAITTASGDARLCYHNQPLCGTYILIAKKASGASAPFQFESAEEFLRYGQVYFRKSFSRQGKTPRIEISTASGDATLEK
jgi:DUF4097 and DUF4098 domain-containing protein YvlB